MRLNVYAFDEYSIILEVFKDGICIDSTKTGIIGFHIEQWIHYYTKQITPEDFNKVIPPDIYYQMSESEDRETRNRRYFYSCASEGGSLPLISSTKI